MDEKARRQQEERDAAYFRWKLRQDDPSIAGTRAWIEAVIVEPASAWPPRYDPVTHFRTSPDIQRVRTPDGIWWHADGRRDMGRSPIKKLDYFQTMR